MPATSVGRRELEHHVGQLLALTPRANELLADLALAEEMRHEYATVGFVKVADVLAPDALTHFVKHLLAVLGPMAELVTTRHEPGLNETLSDGLRFRRVDPARIRDPIAREVTTRTLEELGLYEFGAQLGARITPLIRRIVGPVGYRRIYFYIYEEGDYICAHNDHQVGNRVDIQFPVALETVAGVRVLSDGLFRMHYDSAGSMNVLGPRVWHDVPPLLRGMSGATPQRLNIGLRFTPDA